MLWIIKGKILTMAGKNYDSGTIVIDQGKIIKIGDNISFLPNEDDTIINAKNLWVMPGLIDAHSHIGIMEQKMGVEGDDSNEETTPITPYLRAIDGINPLDPAFHNALQAGITSVMTGPGSSNLVGGQFAFIKTHGRNISEMIVKAPAAIKVSFGENTKRVYKEKKMAPSTRMAMASMLREELFRAVNYKRIKEKAEKANEDFELEYKLEPWLPVLAGEIPLKAHAHRTDDIHTAIRIAKEFNLKLTLDHCSEGHIIADDIKESGFDAIIGPDLASRNKLECQNADFKTSGILSKLGVTVAITTDHPVSLIQYLPLCAGLAAKKGLGIEEGLKAITINPAKICGVDSSVGSLEPGKDADIAIFTGNPMEVFTETMHTIVNGIVVYTAEKGDSPK